MEEVLLREITYRDNGAVGQIVRTVLTGFGVPKEGTALGDKNLDTLFQYYDRKGYVYYVLEAPEGILGGGGIAPLEGASPELCELQKMYLLDEARGRGLGGRLLRRCLEAAREFGYRQCYLETMPTMESAQALYKKMGFRYLQGPVGNTGHCSCQVWMITDL